MVTKAVLFPTIVLSIISALLVYYQYDYLQYYISKSKSTKFEWMKGARIYQVFIDRFAGHKSNYTNDELRMNFLNGNIKALMTKLDYIKSMNFNMIWITPFYVNQPTGYHGYHAENYNHVDPRFAYGQNIEDDNVGDNFDPNDVNVETGADLVLKEFVQECHKRNLKVMMDFVPNHSYETFPIFQDAKNNANSKYRNWFYFSDTVPGGYLTFLGLGILPKLNLENNEVQDYLIKSTEKFLRYGIDAVRVDHAIGPKREGLKAIIDKIHEKFPTVPFIGEILPIGLSANANTVLGTTEETLIKLDSVTLDSLKIVDDLYLEYTDILDGVLDFTFLYYVDFFVNKKTITEEKCTELLEEHFNKFKDYPNFFLLKNLDSHDCDRIMFRCTNNMDLFQKAMKLLYKEYLDKRDLPVIYYGTEDFMTQEKSMDGESYGDHRCRQPMYFGKEWLTNLFEENKNKWKFLMK